ncbi:MAG: amidase domain-containing protein, partial [Oscillospiraceae bacterium]
TKTVNYAYNDAAWADLLTAYDGHNIAYEGQTYANGEVTGNPTSGNPTRYYNGKTWNMEWENGRELSRITRGSKIWDFTYDMAGVRSGKTVTTIDTSTGEITGTTEYKYTTLSGKLVRVEYNTTILDIVYDESGQPFSIRYKSSPTATGALYYYVLNAQGDVIGLMNASGELVVEYKYDPWGKLLETIIGVDETDSKYAAYNNMGLRNPLRYRGYIYDRDTGLYYLQSRYYDPEVGRFINADGYVTTDVLGLLSSNMFAYCTNNPVNYYDAYGFLETRNDGYDGNAAAAYAIKWAYIRNPNFYSYGQDCTNFVSQCLFAGGFKMDDSWHSYRELTTTWFGNPKAWLINQYRYDWDITESWRLAKKQYELLVNSSYCNMVVTIQSKNGVVMAAYKGGILPGDILYFENETKGIYHATIVTKVEDGEIYYAGHTSSRAGHPLSSTIGTDNVRIIKIMR